MAFPKADGRLLIAEIPFFESSQNGITAIGCRLAEIGQNRRAEVRSSNFNFGFPIMD